jgi:TolA-binding protein
MSVTSNRLRRTLTLAVAVAALLLGFAAIRAASAWTAEAAPLVVSPAAATEIQAKLTAEQARTVELEAQIATMSGQADELTTALRAAQERIVTDGGHADQLAADLAAARERLKKLEAAIKAASAQRTVTVVRKAAPSSGGPSPTSHAEHEGEHEGGGDD